MKLLFERAINIPSYVTFYSDDYWKIFAFLALPSAFLLLTGLVYLCVLAGRWMHKRKTEKR